MKILLIGATGTIGSQVLKLLNEKTETVIAVSRNGNPSINIDDPESVKNFFKTNSEFDAIICAAGNASFGKLQDLSNDEIQVGLKSKLMGQVNLAKFGLNKLNPGGVIILTGGMLAYTPWPATTNIAMVNAGLEGFVKAAALELTDGKRILIVHPPLVSETAESMGMDTAPWPKAHQVASVYHDCIDSDMNGVPVFVEGYSPK